ncbi:MAG: trypsin-like peptidase domain-containing protein [Candidatus Bipolaricaulota bacterium]|nr:MAG: trypsin-like peptidase domain-containing protein [Candidatus Bipolaricaulota bacterium]
MNHRRRWKRGVLVLLVGLVAWGTTGASAGGAFELQEQVIRVYEEVAASVVHIAVRGTTEDVFMRPVPTAGSGSGFLFDDDGHIVTNYHVIADAETITVAFDGVDCCPAVVVGVDPSTDLAVLRVERVDLPPPLVLAESSALRVGQFVVAVGNPFGLQGTATFGIISALERVIRSPDGRFIGEAIQTDAAINPGNSGGPLLDLEGRVIGVNSQIISPVEASAGIGFAVASDTVARVVPVLIAQGRFPHPYLGVVGFDLSAERVQDFRESGIELPMARGILVLAVEADSPAERAGLRGGNRTISLNGIPFPLGGDVILEINGTPTSSVLDLILGLESRGVIGAPLTLLVLRDGETLTLTATLAERPESSQSFSF